MISRTSASYDIPPQHPFFHVNPSFLAKFLLLLSPLSMLNVRGITSPVPLQKIIYTRPAFLAYIHAMLEITHFFIQAPTRPPNVRRQPHSQWRRRPSAL